MRIKYYPDTDSLSIDLRVGSYRGPGYGEDLAEGVTVHYSADGELVSVEIESGASRLADLGHLEAEGLPITTVADAEGKAGASRERREPRNAEVENRSRAEAAVEKLEELEPDDFLKVALAVVPRGSWTRPEEFPEDTADALHWAKVWMHEHGFSEDETRQAIVAIDPLSTKRLLRSAEKQKEAVYNALLREGLKHGDLDEARMNNNVARFGGWA